MRAFPSTPFGASATSSRNSARKDARNRSMSLARKIIKRLMITTLVGTGVAYGWLYLKATHVQNYLEQRALVQQAREISDFIVVGDDGSVALNLPPRLAEAYNSVKSRYRSAGRDPN